MREKLITQLEKYIPFNEQEARDKELMLLMLQKEPLVFTRENTHAHVTVSAWITNRERTKTIMAFHNIYQSWSWLGGHADGNENLPEVALREAMEESGIRNARLVTPDILSVEVLTVNGHVKKGKYVSSHLHLNFTYLVEADEAEPLAVKADENSNVQWFSFADAIAASSEDWFKERIYPKLVEKTRRL